MAAGQLERVERGEVDRLMLLLPPRHGKSELASKRYPAWLLGRNPGRQFISVSATAELASDFGRDVRSIIGSPEYRTLFDTRLAEDSQAKGKWHTSAGGIYYAVGIGGSVLGRGGDVILIDDPYSSMEDALSEITRKNVWDWYTGTAYNRLMPNGAIVVINHRMNGGDFTVHIVVGVDPEWRMYVLDLWRAQTSSADWVESFCDLVGRWKPIGWAEETGQIRAGIGPFLERRMRERQTYVARKQFPTRGDKAVRGQSIRGRMKLDGLYVPTQAHWYPALLSELLNFPPGNTTTK
jgi:predicted phage terminase large subunit-like protein